MEQQLQPGTALALRRSNAAPMQVLPQNMAELERVAHAFAHSGAFPDVQSMAQAFVRIQAGQEFGLGPMASMMGVYFIKGKPALAATTIAGCVKKSGIYNYKQFWLTRENRKIVVATDPLNQEVIGCKLTFYENGVEVGDSAFTDTDATLAGLSSGDNWKKFPRNMYFSRAMTNGVRWYAPDLFGGAIYTPDELDDKIELDSSMRPINYAPALPVGVSDQPHPGDEVKPTEVRKVPTNRELLNAYEMAKPFMPPPEVKMRVWLETSGVAPEFTNRPPDELTGKAADLTNDEKILALEKLNEILVASSYRAEPAVPAAKVEPVIDADPPDPFYVEEPVGITQAQSRRIMAMFTERSEAMVRLFPLKKNMDDRRHAFAEHVLSDPAKGSSKTWTPSDYSKVSDELEQVTKNGETE